MKKSQLVLVTFLSLGVLAVTAACGNKNASPTSTSSQKSSQGTKNNNQSVSNDKSKDASNNQVSAISSSQPGSSETTNTYSTNQSDTSQDTVETQEGTATGQTDQAASPIQEQAFTSIDQLVGEWQNTATGQTGSLSIQGDYAVLTGGFGEGVWDLVGKQVIIEGRNAYVVIGQGDRSNMPDYDGLVTVNDDLTTMTITYIGGRAEFGTLGTFKRVG